MLRSVILFSVVVFTLSLDSLEKNFQIEQKPTVSNINCDKIIENLDGCYECYLCDEPKLAFKRKQGSVIHNLTLVDKDCDKTRICCVTQKDLIYRESERRCGISHPEGYPIKVRDRLRQVLDGQYPWRAWVYSKSDPNRPLCAATYINYEEAALLAPALCLQDKHPELLVVRFHKYGQTNKDHNVKSIAVHPEFDKDTHENDIALIKLDVPLHPGLPPQFSVAVPVCLPRVQLPLASTCIGVSDDNNFINFVVPKQSLCNETDPNLPNSLMCAVAPPRDYKQEYGSGLFCLDDNVKEPSYTVHGIMLDRSGDSISLYTNISHFKNWIETKVTETWTWGSY